MWIGTEAVDERPVNFDGVEREALQVAERRIADAEVVDRQIEPERLETCEGPLEVVDVLHEDALGQLEAKVGGIDTSASQDVGDEDCDVRRTQLGDRHVDCDGELGRQRPAVTLPTGQVLARLLEYPCTDRNDQAGLLGDGDEVSRNDQTVVRVLPPQQGLDADHQAGRQVDDRLVLNGELVVFERSIQRRSCREASFGDVAQRVIEQLDTAPAALFGAVHGCVGVAQQTLGRRITGGDGDAEAGRDAQLVTGDVARAAERLEHAFADAFGLESRDIVTHDDELVAADPRHRVAGTDRAGDSLGSETQERIAGAVTKRVVDDLELIDIEEHHAELGAAPARAGQSVEQAVVEQGAIWQTGERVVKGLVGKIVFHALAFGDVLELSEEVLRRAVLVANQRHVGQHPHDGAVRLHEAPLVVVALTAG